MNYIHIFLLILCFFSCRNRNYNILQSNTIVENTLVKSINDITEKKEDVYVKRKDTGEFIILYPKYSKIDLVCGVMPLKSDTSVILCAEAAYTGQCLNDFVHINIAGDHVSNGERYKGYKCIRNTGAFIYYNNQWMFLYKNYSDMMNVAAKNNGCAFAQEMIIYDDEIKPTVRKDNSKNIFRALCQIENRICIIESCKIISFGDFKKNLKKIGVKNAIYLDMGSGWNYAWYRQNKTELIEMHSRTHDYCTNWITFYR